MTPYWSNGWVDLYQADARELPLADKSVQACICSPPYWNLRVYQGVDARGIGNEATVEAYLADLRACFREVHRVLRDDGVLWCNVGSSYDGGNDIAIPWRLALALQEDGWILRSDVIWAKPAPMPESVGSWRWEKCRLKVAVAQLKPVGKSSGLTNDGTNSRIVGGLRIDQRGGQNTQWADCPGCPRCEQNGGLVLRKGSWRSTCSHEYIFMFVKSMGYYADGEAVREPHTMKPQARLSPRDLVNGKDAGRPEHRRPQYQLRAHFDVEGHPAGRNRRSVWNDIRPDPFPGGHYATFPEDLPKLCILASTPEAGCCAACGAPWARDMQIQNRYNKRHEYQDMQQVPASVVPDGISASGSVVSEFMPGVRGQGPESQILGESGTRAGTIQSLPVEPQGADRGAQEAICPESGRQGDLAEGRTEIPAVSRRQADATAKEPTSVKNGKREAQWSDSLCPPSGTVTSSRGNLHKRRLGGGPTQPEQPMLPLSPEVQPTAPADHGSHHTFDQGGQARQDEHSGIVPPMQLDEVQQADLFVVTLGFRPSCGCGDVGVVPALVLDNFGGVGTTAVAAMKLGRRAVCTDLSKEYLDLAKSRLERVPLPLKI